MCKVPEEQVHEFVNWRTSFTSTPVPTMRHVMSFMTIVIIAKN